MAVPAMSPIEKVVQSGSTPTSQNLPHLSVAKKKGEKFLLFLYSSIYM